MMRAFTNHVLGMPYREQGARPKLDTVISLRGTYRSGTVPAGVIFLTAGADVQRGSERDPNNPPRIELEVCGHGLGYRSFSILYKVFEGAVDDPFDGAWEKLHQWGVETGLKFARQDGVIFNTMLTLIDSGDGMHTDAVYAFCSRWQNTYPSKGYGILKKTKDKLGDEKTAFNFDRYRQKQIGTDVRLYEISTNHYKTIVYRNLNVTRKADGSTGPGFSDFPVDYSEKYFDMLTAEERRADGSYHAGQRRNEALDCRVLCMAGHDIILEAEVYARREQAKRNGATSVQLAEIRKRAVMQEWEAIVNSARRPAGLV